MTATETRETPTGIPESALSEEDRGRADLYAVLARLFYAAPDRALLDTLARHEGLFGSEDVPLGQAWNALVRAARAADPEVLRLDYDSVFVGVGKAAVTLYCSHYLTPSGRDRIVVALRDELRELALGRTADSHEPEDHLAVLCEVMRHLVSLGSDDHAIGRQKQFFMRYISNAYIQLTDEILSAAAPHFYKDVARVMRAFCDVESQSFEMV
ncbi:MAG TPA: molecular chaperone TorD family protein [Burkholderiales bacterium]|nr:molecular chaperone TorD family protein [Burkholderiales bacterium]